MKQHPRPVFFTLVVFTASLLLAQGIQSPLVDLPLPGDWEERPEWVAEAARPEKLVFYDRMNGTVLHIRRRTEPFKVEELPELMRQFQRTESGLTKRSGFARFLAIAFFPLPKAYVKQVAQVLDPPQVIIGQAARIFSYRFPGQKIGRRTKAPRIWDVKKVEGNAQNFYVSQLTPGFFIGKHAAALAIEEEYARTWLTRAELRRTNGGEALLFELETEQPAVKKAVKRFRMPPTLKNQQIRFGWIEYSPEGFTAAKPSLSIVFATPLNSGLDCDAVLGYLARTNDR